MLISRLKFLQMHIRLMKDAVSAGMITTAKKRLLK